MDITNFGQGVLKSFYKEDKIIPATYNYTQENEVSSNLIFPTFKDSLDDMGHVSNSQMDDACVQAAYILAAKLVNLGFVENNSVEDFKDKMKKMLLLEKKLQYTRELKGGDSGILITSGDLKIKSKGSIITFKTVHTGDFIQGEVDYLYMTNEAKARLEKIKKRRGSN